METMIEQEERIAKKIAAATWPEDVPVPARQPKLRLSGRDGNVFFILGRAHFKAKAAKWTEAQWDAFYRLATAGNYDHALRTCMRFFDVS